MNMYYPLLCKAVLAGNKESESDLNPALKGHKGWLERVKSVMLKFPRVPIEGKITSG
jgi:hypothetical protein